MAEGLPEEANGIGERRKTTETESRSSLSTVYVCTGKIPAKIEQTADGNQSDRSITVACVGAWLMRRNAAI